MIPVFINVRDRVTDLRELVAWLERAGHERITLIDNDSTYPPLLEYLDQTPHAVVRVHANIGKHALWRVGLAPQEEPFVYTDPDLMPVEDCPLDAVEHLWDLLQSYPVYPKVALGLYLDDVPADLPSLDWERGLVTPGSGLCTGLAPGVFGSMSDTTFAVHRPGAGFAYASIRTGFPYQCRHGSWYVREPGEEDSYYLDRAQAGPEFSSWLQARRTA